MFKKIAMLLIVIFTLAACSNGEKETTIKKSNADQTPGFDLMDTKGKTHDLADYAGKKVYIKFWASWCPICLSGLEEINALSTEDNDFVVLTVVAPGYNNEKKTDAFIKWFNGVEEAPDLTVLLDEDGVIAKQYQVRGYPTSAFIDTKGNLVKTQAGHIANDQIKEEFNKIK